MFYILNKSESKALIEKISAFLGGKNEEKKDNFDFANFDNCI